MKIVKNNRGFSLIEVMIALLVLALGILGISKLQGTLIRNSSDANQRSLASSLAQMKIDDLKSYVLMNRADVDGDGQIETTADDAWQAGLPPSQQSFSYIATNQGGAADSSPDNVGDFNRNQLVNGDIAFENYIFNLQWTVTDYYYTGTPPVAIEPIPAGEEIDFKTVVVDVTWDDETGEQQQVRLSTVIDSYAPAFTSLSDNSSIGAEPPIVSYTPQAAPDVIPITVSIPPPPGYSSDSDDSNYLPTSDYEDVYKTFNMCDVVGIRETDVPDPDLDENSGGVEDNTIVSFSSTIYRKANECFDSNGDGNFINSGNFIFEKVRVDEFKSINCTCELGNSGIGYDQENNEVTKSKTGTKSGQANQQHNLCIDCCRDHHENISGDNQCDVATEEGLKYCYDPFRPSTDYLNDDHNHYAASDLSTPITATGAIYNEACRFKLEDGILAVIQDWKMIELANFVESDLAVTANISDRDSSVVSMVNTYLSTAALPSTVWAAPTPTVPTDGTQMAARSLFVNYMSVSDKTGLDFSGSTIPFEVPFYEFKTTNLVNWETANTDGTTNTSIHTSTASPCPADLSANDTCVDSPTVSQVINVNNNQTIDKGMYRVSATAPTTDINIIAKMKSSVTGVIAYNSIDPDDNDLVLNQKQTELLVSYGSGGNAGNIGITLPATAGFTCPATWGNGNNAPDFTNSDTTLWGTIGLVCMPSAGTPSCDGYSGSQTSVDVTASDVSVLSCEYGSDTYSCPTSVMETVTNLNGTKTCSIQMVKAGNSSSCNLVCN